MEVITYCLKRQRGNAFRIPVVSRSILIQFQSSVKQPPDHILHAALFRFYLLLRESVIIDDAP